MSGKVKLPKGTRDFLPNQMLKREYILDIIQSTFKNFGFLPIETPAMEDLTTLTGKYGEEGDRLIFKILNNGDFLSKVEDQLLESKDSSKALGQLSKRALRYDLTVPFARFVVMNRNELQFPFKRYQIQPVWRADRPQKGRYQEFYQCDVDVVGSSSLVYEAELVQIYQQVFSKLNIPVDIRINNRKILTGIAEFLEIEQAITKFTVIIDKLDKIGMEKVVEQLSSEFGFDEEKSTHLQRLLECEQLEEIIQITGDQITVLNEGIEELNRVFNFLRHSGASLPRFDVTLARGLNYYTGCIFEVNALNVNMGSIGGGGRYDNLTEIFGLSDMSGVGVSFGAERIYDVMEELNLFPDTITRQKDILIIPMDDRSMLMGFELISQLRNGGYVSDLYPDLVKMKKSMKYADATGVPYVLIIGEKELETKTFVLKDMMSGEQHKVSKEELFNFLGDVIKTEG